MKLNFERKYSLNFVPPRAQRGTHGWIVVLGACLVFMFNISIATTFNEIFAPIFDNSDDGSVRLATNIYEVLSNLTVICTGFLMEHLSAKHFVVIGSSLLFIGLVISAFATNLGQLILTFSIIIGFGMGLMNPATFIAVLSCFNSSRNRAIGVVFASLGLGQLMMPHIAGFLLINFAFQKVISFIAALSLIGLVGAHLLAPIKWKNCEESTCNNNNEASNTESRETQPLLPQSHRVTVVANRVIHDADLELLIDYKFLTLSIGLSFIFALSVDLTKIFPKFLSDKFGLDETQALICTYIIRVADVISRLTFAFITDAFKYSSKTVFLIGLVMTSIARLLMLIPILNFESILFICVILGTFRALTVVNQILVIVDFSKGRCPRRVPGMIGLAFVFKSIFVIVSEYLYDNLDDYTVHICTHLLLQLIIIVLYKFIL